MLKRLLTLICLLFVFYLLPFSWSVALRDQTARVFTPIGSYLVRQNDAVSTWVRSLRQISSLRQDKTDLQKEIIGLQQELSTLQTAKRENEVLRKELGVAGTVQSAKKVLAHVVLRGSDLQDKTVTVDVGSGSGVRVGQPVVSQGALVGRVTSAGSHSSLIQLITSTQSRIQVWVSESREKGLLLGDGSNLHLSDITQGVEVREGQVVETSGLGGSLPQGILVGEITQTESKKSDLSQRFFVKPAQDPTSLESVFILLTDAP